MKKSLPRSLTLVWTKLGVCAILPLATLTAQAASPETEIARQVQQALTTQHAGFVDSSRATPVAEVAPRRDATELGAALRRTLRHWNEATAGPAKTAHSPAPPASNANGKAAPAPRAAALMALRQANPNVIVHLRPGNQTVVQMRGGVLHAVGRGVGLAARPTPDQTAREFLRAQAGVLRLEDPDRELTFTAAQQDDSGARHLRYAQTWQGLPVWPAGLSVHLDREGNVESLDGAYVPSPRLQTQPTLTAAQATERAREAVRGGEEATASEPELIIYAPMQNAPRLAWKLELTLGFIDAWRLVIDAHTGAVLLRESRVLHENIVGSGIDLTGTKRALNVWRTANGTHWLADTTKKMFQPGFDPIDNAHGVITIADARGVTVNELKTIFTIRSDTADTWPISDGVSAAFNFSETYDYYLERHNRNSLDGAGGNVTAVVNVGNYNNASWHGNLKLMFFGTIKPFAAALDVVGHELTHGVTENSAGLVYENQSGAMNEAFSDIFGEMVEARVRGRNDWLIGSELPAPIRNMKTPGAIVTGYGKYPSKMSEYIQLANDNEHDHGGVHYNSSIINHAFYLLAEGLPGAVGLRDAEKIFYRTLTAHLQAQSQFIDCRLGALASAEELFGRDSTQARKVAEAFDAVEILPAPTTPDPTPVPVVLGPDSTLVISGDLLTGDYDLERIESAFGDAQGAQLAPSVRFTRPAVTGDGSGALFVSGDFDLCAVETGNPATRQCLGFAGKVHSVAFAPDGKLAAFVLRDAATGQAEDRITLVDLANNTVRTFQLLVPAVDGAAVDQVLYADSMVFSTDGTTLYYDALSRLAFGNGPIVERWSIYALNLTTEKTSIIVPPVDGLDAGNPALGRAGNRYLTFDAHRDADGHSAVMVLDLFTGKAGAVGLARDGYGYPSLTGDESAVIFATRDPGAVLTGYSLLRQPLSTDRLTAAGEAAPWINDAVLGVIYRRGVFSGTNALPTVAITSPADGAPFPASAAMQIIARAADADGTVAKVEFYDGATLLGSTVTANGGQYTFTWNNAPSGEHRLIARAIDNLGGAGDSSPVTVKVGPSETPGQRISLGVARMPNGAMRLSVRALAGEYIIQQSSTLSPGGWVDIYPVTVAAGGTGTVDDAGGPTHNTTLFYRVRKAQ